MLVLLKAKFWDNLAENCFPLAANEPESGGKIMEKKKDTVLVFFIFYFLFGVHRLPRLP